MDKKERKNERLMRSRTVIASRLDELLKMRGLSQADLLRKTKLHYGLEMKAPQLSQILSKKRSLMPDFAVKFSEVLNVESGYLLGADDYRASDYEAYVDLYGSSYEKLDKKLSTYYDLLSLIGFRINGMSAINEEVKDYDIQHSGQIATIPASEMEKFYEDVKTYMRKRIAPLMEMYKEA